jgi:lipoate-protein ligase A
MNLYTSEERNPFFHLAAEDWLLRQTEGESVFLYQNSPSVVLGRFQNPWLECDLAWMKKNGITLVRRPSGGGTVWHDEGNVNFCWVGPLQGFKKTNFLEIVKANLQKLGVSVEINARHDLVVPQADGGTRKVSGSAFKQTKDRTLHHGTLLLSGDLTQLNRALKSPHTLVETRSIPSVRSQVANLSSLKVSKWISSWGDSQVLKSSDSRFDAQKWSEWAWVMGETPFFRWSLKIQEEVIELSAHKGLIQELHWPQRNIKFEKLLKPLEAATFYELSQGSIDLALWQDVLGV